VKKKLNGIWQCELPGDVQFSMEIPNCWEKYSDRKDIGGTVVLSRDFDLDLLTGRSYFLCFDAVSYHCKVFLNNRELGTHEGMWDSFSFPVSDILLNGRNSLRVEVEKPGYYDDDPYPLRQVLSGFIPDVLCTFGGIWGDVWVEDCMFGIVDYHYAMGTADGSFSIHWGVVTENADQDIACRWEIFDSSGIQIRSGVGNAAVLKKSLGGYSECAFSVNNIVKNPRLWSSREPNLYTYNVELESDGENVQLSGSFGFRTIHYQGTQLLLNNEPIYMRGILHWGYYDRNYIPVPSTDEIDLEILGIRRYGFNAIKHCLYVPGKEYLSRADEEGILQWVELPLWLPEANEHLSERIRREFPRIIRKIAGHPSIVFTSLGCELDATVDGAVLQEMYHLVKESTATLVRDNSGSGECYGGLKEDYADFWDYHFYGDLQNMENLMETFTPGWRNFRPWVYGEFCDSDTLRDMPAIRSANGEKRVAWESGDFRENPISRLKPDFYLDHYEERMEKSGISQDFKHLHMLSIDHSMVHRKTTLEMTRSFPGIGGYNITAIRDVPICSNGLFDDLGAAKFDAEEFRKFNFDVILLPAWDLTRIWEHGDRVMHRERYNFFGGSEYRLTILVSNYLPSNLKADKMLVHLINSTGQVILEDTIEPDQEYFKTGVVTKAAEVICQLPVLESPEDYLLRVELYAGDQVFTNQWPVFTYPEQLGNISSVGLIDPMNIFHSLDKLYSVKTAGETVPEEEILITSYLSPEALDFAKKGGGVFYVQRGAGILPAEEVSFWREGMIVRQPHSLWSEVKRTSYMDDLRMFSLSTDTAFLIEQFQDLGFTNPVSLIRRYDCREWKASDYMVEMAYGKGRIIATTLRIEGGMGKQPRNIVNNPFGRWILHQAMQYLMLNSAKG